MCACVCKSKSRYVCTRVYMNVCFVLVYKLLPHLHRRLISGAVRRERRRFGDEMVACGKRVTHGNPLLLHEGLETSGGAEMRV